MKRVSLGWMLQVRCQECGRLGAKARPYVCVECDKRLREAELSDPPPWSLEGRDDTDDGPAVETEPAPGLWSYVSPGRPERYYIEGVAFSLDEAERLVRETFGPDAWPIWGDITRVGDSERRYVLVGVEQ